MDNSTRRALHGVAELVLAGPQYRRSGTIRLRVCPGGFGTVAEPELRVEEGWLVVAGGRRLALRDPSPIWPRPPGSTSAPPVGPYHDGSGDAPTTR